MTTNFDKINMLYKNEHENSFTKSIMSLNRKFLGSAYFDLYFSTLYYEVTTLKSLSD